MLLHLADTLRRLLIPFLAGGTVLVAGLCAFVIVQRGLRELAFQRQQRLKARYRPAIDALIGSTPAPDALRDLLAAPHRHRALIGSLLLAPLRIVTGEPIARARAAADALDLTPHWRQMLRDRRWWQRADAARALGLLRAPDSLAALEPLLDDAHEEVRAAAVEAMGRLADPAAIPLLLARLHDQTRHQTARLVEALRAFGPPVTPALLAHGKSADAVAPVLIDLLALIGSPAAVPDLLRWSRDTRPDVRAAAMTALGSLGLDERGYYYALQALEDDDADVRAAAGRALGRAGRAEAASALARRLDDDWLVAASCAQALRSLGAAGRHELERRRHEQSPAADLARQMLWERDTSPVAVRHPRAARES